MKRLFTFVLSLLALSVTGWAQDIDQTFQFTDTLGNVVPDGTVITVNAINAEGQMVIPLKVKNVSDEKAAVSMFETIDTKPGGEWQTCAFGNCMTLSESGYSPKSVVDVTYDNLIETEWIPEAGSFASWSATLQIHVFNITTKTVFGRVIEQAGDEIIGYGPKVTVNFVYNAESANISSAEAPVRPLQYYSICGKRLDAPQKGLNIVKLSNGKTIKVIIK